MNYSHESDVERTATARINMSGAAKRFPAREEIGEKIVLYQGTASAVP